MKSKTKQTETFFRFYVVYGVTILISLRVFCIITVQNKNKGGTIHARDHCHTQ